jgi:hypothetical protein
MSSSELQNELLEFIPAAKSIFPQIPWRVVVWLYILSLE